MQAKVQRLKTGPIQLRERIHSLVLSLEGRAWQELEPSHGSGTLHPEQVLGGSLPMLSPPLDVPTLAARCLRPQRRERS